MSALRIGLTLAILCVIAAVIFWRQHAPVSSTEVHPGSDYAPSIIAQPITASDSLHAGREPAATSSADSLESQVVIRPPEVQLSVEQLPREEQIKYYRRQWIEEGLRKFDDPELTLKAPEVRRVMMISLAVILDSQGRAVDREPNEKVKLDEYPNQRSMIVGDRLYRFDVDEFAEFRDYWLLMRQKKDEYPETESMLGAIRNRAQYALQLLN